MGDNRLDCQDWIVLLLEKRWVCKVFLWAWNNRRCFLKATATCYRRFCLIR